MEVAVVLAGVLACQSPLNDDGSVNASIEISLGDRRKWELNMGENARVIDHVMPEDLGGYHVNYGFAPHTVSYDGDPDSRT